MRAWGKDILIGFGLAELLAVIAWLAGGGATVQAIILLVGWPLLTPAAHRLRRGSAPTPQNP